jgi:hypothetical protein
MERSTVLAAIIASLSLLSADARPPQAPQPQPTRSTSCSIDGGWFGTGVDDFGTQWTFPMRFRQTGDLVDVTIAWHGSNGHDGPESARGTFDCAAHRLDLRTVSTSPSFAPALYHADVAPDTRSMRGHWEGATAVPGHFTAVRR